MEADAPVLNAQAPLELHQRITQAVHEQGSCIMLQILHAGRYARVPECVGPSPIKARINIYAPREMTPADIARTTQDFVQTSLIAQQCGYDGVEVMGSEGYLLNEFVSPVTNQRTDEYGGDFERRIRFPLEVVRAIRAQVPEQFVIVYRISSIDLMDGGMNAAEIAEFARRLQAAGADILNTGVGWHESAVPTIAAAVPRAAWAQAVRNVKQAVSIPVMASNRINMPAVGEELIASGVCDLVSMARPMLADPEFVNKTRAGRVDEINTCIACNQACLDHIFSEKPATCLVNPRAGRELDFVSQPASQTKRVAVVGGGAAGMAFAVNAAERGHAITLFEAAPDLGGQLNYARQVPGKSEFNELIRYFKVRMARLGVVVHTGRRVNAAELKAGGFDEVVIASGVKPRLPGIAGQDHAKVVNYTDVLSGRVQVGQRVAIIGAGGIGFDVAEYLVGHPDDSTEPQAFMDYWGVDIANQSGGGLAAAPATAAAATPQRQITMFQRKPESLGKNLGKTTGWVLKAKLRNARVKMVAGATYHAIDDAGLHYSAGGEDKVLPVDHVVLCAGQESDRGLVGELQDSGLKMHIIGGADVAAELDALRAIDQATRLALSI
jgi:2,4-dienoyl-CoA reductase (NADPH2)